MNSRSKNDKALWWRSAEARPRGIFVRESACGGKDNSLPAENNKNRSLIPQQQFSSSNQLQTTQTN